MAVLISIRKVKESSGEATYECADDNVKFTAVVRKSDGSVMVLSDGHIVPEHVPSKVKRKLYLHWNDGQYPDVTCWAS